MNVSLPAGASHGFLASKRPPVARRPIPLVAAAAALATVCSAGRARALGPLDLEVAARGGIASSPTSDSPDPLGAGLGGRAGVSLFGLYGGLSLMYYFGSSATQAGVTVKTHTLMYGIEGGYNLGIPLLKVRPQLGIGNFELGASCASATGPICTSKGFLYVEPGVTGLLTLGQFLIGADADLLLVPAIDQAKPAGVLNAQLGVKF